MNTNKPSPDDLAPNHYGIPPMHVALRLVDPFGDFHIVIDDGNLEDSNLKYCLDNATPGNPEIPVMQWFASLSMAERTAAFKAVFGKGDEPSDADLLATIQSTICDHINWPENELMSNHQHITRDDSEHPAAIDVDVIPHDLSAAILKALRERGAQL